MPPRKAWLAALLSVLSPGLGQLYALRPARAAVAFVISLAAVVAVVLPTWIHLGAGGILLGLGIGFGAILLIVVDAATVARQTTTRESRAAYDHWYVYLGLALLIAFGVRAPFQRLLKTHLVEAFHVPSEAMEPTIVVGDLLYVDRHDRRLATLRRGDIVVFTSVDDPGIKVIKRVAGLPGDTLAMRDGTLLRNGRPVPEPYTKRIDPSRPDAGPARAGMRQWQLAAYVGAESATYTPSRQTWGPLRVASDVFFVLGDNRDNSYDSRYWGFVPADHLYGRMGTIYFSYDPDAVSLFPILTAVRWRRIGMVPR